ncbi:ABC transporter substrate-binding protein [Clostridium aestuarii]|uniref:ABC transporter substrate-binding protein n=1 Tax=Clostridium aestuarii TaxID=338193 RepID=A0ABT4D357_9CLOT|nr:ABC transporter substrate-binding protein [Clostridium aestuarii]MCY6485664.1 ABC transporter substrate-binding protein [Clostridium aestuarii]
MKRKLLAAALTSVFVATTLFAGCGAKNSAETSGAKQKDTAQTEKKKAKTLVFAQGTDPRGLDPAYVDDGESAKIIANVYDGLLRYKKDSTELEPSLATEWKVSDDGKVYTFKLREGVKFHDGTDFNAEAVKVSIERQLPPKRTNDMPYASFTFGEVEKVEVVNDYSVKITLKEPYTPFLANLAMVLAAPIVSPTALEKYDGKLMENPVGTGPFKFVKWDKGQSIVLEKNEDYWDEEKAKVDKAIFQFTKENSVRATQLMTGAVDIIDGVDPNDVAQIEKSGATIYKRPGMNINYMAFNCERAPFNDAKLREAISYAINREELVKFLYQGYSSIANSQMPSFIPGFNDKVKPYEYNPEKAKTMLKELGKEKLEIKMIIYSNPRPYNTVGQKLAEAIQGYLLKVGIKSTIEPYTWTEYKEKAKQGEGDIMFYGWTGDNGDPDNFLSLLDSKEIESSLNAAKYSNKKVDELLSKARRTPNGEERNKLYKDIQDILAKDAPWLPISSAEVMAGHSAKVKGFGYHPTGVVYLKYVDKE